MTIDQLSPITTPTNRIDPILFFALLKWLDGKKIGDFRKAWQTACVAAGLGVFVKKEQTEGDAKEKRQRKKYDGLIIHDLRRCAARNLSRSGVSEVVAMKITGHMTASMYRRYRIIDENEIREALEKTQDHLSASQESKIAKAGGAKA